MLVWGNKLFCRGESNDITHFSTDFVSNCLQPQESNFNDATSYLYRFNSQRTEIYTHPLKYSYIYIHVMIPQSAITWWKEQGASWHQVYTKSFIEQVLQLLPLFQRILVLQHILYSTYKCIYPTAGWEFFQHTCRWFWGFIRGMEKKCDTRWKIIGNYFHFGQVVLESSV